METSKMPSIKLSRFIGLSIILMVLTHPLWSASIDINLLRPSDPQFSADSRAVTEAVTFALLPTSNQTKSIGRYEPKLEFGYHLLSVDDRRISPYTTNQHSDSLYQSIFIRGGIGLPFGFSIDLAGVTTITNERLTGILGTLNYQLIDLSNMVYVDVVPSISLHQTILRSLSKPSLYSFSSQVAAGAYLRDSLLQFAYVFQYDYSILEGLSPWVTKWFFRHGALLEVPIYKTLFLRSEIFLPRLSGTLSLGYQF